MQVKRHSTRNPKIDPFFHSLLHQLDFTLHLPLYISPSAFTSSPQLRLPLKYSFTSDISCTMMQMWLLWWAKNTATTKDCADADAAAATAAATTTSTTTTNSTETSPSCYGSCLRKLVRKVKKQGKAMLRAATAGRPNKFECQYDPSSYSLNFDTRIDDEDYYQFYAFSSRFAANPRTSSSTLEAGSH